MPAALPIDEMLMVDRITEIHEDGGANGKGRIVAEMDVNPDFQQLSVKGNRDRSRTPVLGDDRQPS